jgi:hypothetical protein
MCFVEGFLPFAGSNEAVEKVISAIYYRRWGMIFATFSE